MRLRTSLHALLGFGDGIGIRHRIVRRRQFLHRAVQFLAAGLVQEFQLGLLAHQFHFDLRALLAGLPAPPRAAVFNSSSPARSASRMRGILRRHLVDRALPARRSLPASSAAFRSSSMLSASSRARMLAQPLDLRRDARCAAPRSRGTAAPAAPWRARLAAMPLLQPGQFRPRRRVLFADGGGLPFQLLQFLAARLRAPLPGPPAVAPSPPPPRGCARAARPISRRRAAAAPAPAAPPKAANSSARQVLAQLAHVVIQRHAVLLARLLQAPQPLQLALPAPAISLVQLLQPRRHLLVKADPAACSFAASSRASRFMASGPARRFLAARHRVPVVANAVGHQEIQVRIRHRQPLRRRPVFRQEAQRNPRQQVDGAVLESVGQAQ